MSRIMVFCSDREIKMPRKLVFRLKREIKIVRNSKIVQENSEIKMQRKCHTAKILAIYEIFVDVRKTIFFVQNKPTRW